MHVMNCTAFDKWYTLKSKSDFPFCNFRMVDMEHQLVKEMSTKKSNVLCVVVEVVKNAAETDLLEFKDGGAEVRIL